jgi:flagellar basal body P-ring formation protein FlgA
MRIRSLTPSLVLLALTLLATGAAAQEEPPVAARDLARGVALEAADVLGGSELVGWVTRRVVREGEVLRPPAIAPPEMVRSGDTVQGIWRHGGMEIRVQGRAMNSAAEGERVSVRVDARRRFEGVAAGSGVVRLDSPETSRER